MKRNSKKGFTLMEMLIVVAIIGVLAAIAIPTFSGSLKKAKVAADVANVRAAYAEAVTKNLTEGKAFKDINAPTGLNYGEYLTWDNTTSTSLHVTYDSDATAQGAELDLTAAPYSVN